jgi:hypothetical protein
MLAPATASATILTFDEAGGVTNSEALDQTYGDRVTMSPDVLGHGYGVGAEGFTPNVLVSYGAAGEQPDLWTTGFGDLTNIYFNDTDNDTTLTVRFTADSGFLVNLYSFDMASFVNAGQTIQGFTVRDVGANSVLFSQGSTLISGSTHNNFNFATALRANDLELVVNLSGLGGASDDIGLDNIRFGQSAVAAVPEPATWALMILGFGGAGAMLRRRRPAVA